MMRRFIYETLHPEIYHGYKKGRPYFEGWYYKLVSADEQIRYSVIPGIFKGQHGGDHAFVQILDGMTGNATYHEFPIETFQADEETFDVWVGDNHFRRDCFSLNINDEQAQISGMVELGNGRGWPVTLLEPGVMGWYGWLPIMECYHGVLSFNHSLSGALTVNGDTLDFAGGRGYMEKDWGQAFPSAYVWTQSNHFESPDTSFFASVALIPSLGRTWRGFLCGFQQGNELIRFATYTGAKVESLRLTDKHVYLIISDKHYRVDLTAERGSGGLLKAPVRTEMHKRVDETMKSSLDLRITSVKNGKTFFEGAGRNAALEVHGDLDKLLNTQ